MTAGDEVARKVAAIAAVGMIVAALLLGGGCSARQGGADEQTAGLPGQASSTTGASSGTTTSAESPLAAGSESAVPATVPAADEQAIRATIDQLNATAAGDVPDQQAVLAAVVDPALSSALAGCGPATTTLRLEPVYQGLRADPPPATGDGPPAGTSYALPSLIRIFTGDRITATDLTTLHLDVRDGEAFLTPLCVN